MPASTGPRTSIPTKRPRSIELPTFCGFTSSLRVGEDWRTQDGAATPKSSFFAQAILAYSFGQYVRLTAVPTYLQRTNGRSAPQDFPVPGDQSCVFKEGFTPPYRCSGLYENVVNIPVGASIAITHSITVHGEVIPALSKVHSKGVGWSVSVEKSLLRHRFAFYAGNVRQTTVDGYVQAAPAYPAFQRAKDVYHRLQPVPGVELQMRESVRMRLACPTFSRFCRCLASPRPSGSSRTRPSI